MLFSALFSLDDQARLGGSAPCLRLRLVEQPLLWNKLWSLAYLHVYLIAKQCSVCSCLSARSRRGWTVLVVGHPTHGGFWTLLRASRSRRTRLIRFVFTRYKIKACSSNDAMHDLLNCIGISTNQGVARILREGNACCCCYSDFVWGNWRNGFFVRNRNAVLRDCIFKSLTRLDL